MKVCLVSTGYPPEDGGGIGTYIYNLSQGLTELGHSVFVITKTDDNDREDLIDGVHVFRLKNRYISKLERFVPGFAWSWFLSNKIKAIDKQYGLDIIEFPNWEGVGFCYLLKKKRKAVVTRVHTPYFETLSIDKNNSHMIWGDRFICWMEKIAVKRSDVISSSTEYHKQVMSQAYGINPQRIHVLPLGINMCAYTKPAEVSSKILKVLYVSRLEKRKGTLTLLEAIPKVIKSYQNIEFTLIGKDRPHAPGDMYHKDFFQNKYPDYVSKVNFMGFVSNEELSRYYAGCDIFVVPSVYESFGLIYVEAMMYGKPVIGCKAGGIPEVVLNNETGLLIDPLDTEMLALNIIKMCNDSDLRKKMGENGRKRAENFFNKNKMAQASSDLYHKSGMSLK